MHFGEQTTAPPQVHRNAISFTGAWFIVFCILLACSLAQQFGIFEPEQTMSMPRQLFHEQTVHRCLGVQLQECAALDDDEEASREQSAVFVCVGRRLHLHSGPPDLSLGFGPGRYAAKEHSIYRLAAGKLYPLQYH